MCRAGTRRTTRQQEGQEKLGGEGAAVLGGVVRGGLPEEAVFTQNAERCRQLRKEGAGGGSSV